ELRFTANLCGSRGGHDDPIASTHARRHADSAPVSAYPTGLSRCRGPLCQTLRPFAYRPWSGGHPHLPTPSCVPEGWAVELCHYRLRLTLSVHRDVAEGLAGRPYPACPHSAA